MAEAPARIFGFDPYAIRDAGGALAGAGATLLARRVHAMWNVRGNPADAQFMREAADAFGVALPRMANTANGGNGVRALWLGPDEWIVAADSDIAPRRMGGATLVDVSHGRAVVRLSGAYARDALAKGCPVDLDARFFPVNACAQTAIARVNVLVDHIDSGVFDLYCSRSYAGSLWHWLTEAAAEYGCNVVPPA